MIKSVNGLLLFSLLCIFEWLEANDVGFDPQKCVKNTDTPEYILPCYKTDPNLNTCLQGTFNHLRPYLTNGIPEIGVPSIDPFQLEKIFIENGKGPLKVRAGFYNISASGAQEYRVENIRANVNNYTIDVRLKLPQISIRGKYDVNGNVLLFPVQSRGEFWAVFLNVDVPAKLFGVEYTRENVKYMRVDQILLDFNIKKSRFKVKDKINHNNVIGEAMNRFLNQNSKEIIKEMKPATRQAISSYFKGFLNAAFTNLPMNIWLPECVTQ